MDTTGTDVGRAPWNKGKLVGQKAPLKVKEMPVRSPAHGARNRCSEDGFACLRIAARKTHPQALRI